MKGGGSNGGGSKGGGSKGGGSKGGGSKGGAPKAAGRVRADRVGAQNFAFFFPCPAAKFVLFFPLWGSSRGILVVFEAPGRSNVHVWSSRAVVVRAPAARSGCARKGWLWVAHVIRQHSSTVQKHPKHGSGAMSIQGKSCNKIH